MADAPDPLLVVGRTSFLARHTLAALGERPARAVSHDQLDDPRLLDGVGCAVSFAKHPGIHRDGYDLERDDPDVRLARRIGERPVRFLMLSSRKVYAPAERPLHETMPLGPTDAYGRNKLAVEQRLRALLGERLVVLRLANIFGFEIEPGRRTFAALLLRTLRENGQIRFDMSPFVKRDFLPAERAGAIIAGLTEPLGALPSPLNIGSGVGLACGLLALWVIEGYGRGELVIERPDERDPFVLDVRRLEELTGPVIERDALREACRDLGRRLRTPSGALPSTGR